MVTAPGLHYTIDVRLDTGRNRLDGWTTIRYRSGADSALPAIHLHAYPNAFSGPRTIYAREGEREVEKYDIRFARPSERGWMTIDSVTADGAPARIVMNETLARVDLPHPLAPGGSVALRLHFTVQIPKQFDRFGHTGNAYSIAQWYPKVVVYDDLGWHLDPFHFMSEFYGEYATYDVTVTLPDRLWVGATGVPCGAEGGDNEIPRFPAETPRDSVTVSMGVVLADSLAGRWPAGTLDVETDLELPHGSPPVTIAVPRQGHATLRVPRSSPVHYSYHWKDAKGVALEEADAAGRPGPLRLILAARDLAVQDTLRALAAKAGPRDTILPSLKTLRFRAERVHDFAWVACPDYVGSDTTWAGIEVSALVFREDAAKWREIKAQTVDALRHHTRVVGPYVWPRFTATEAFCGGGAMEYPMLVMDEPAMYSGLVHSLDDTNAHEVGHEWFYGMLGSDERAHPWMDEGFTQYIEHDYTDAKYPHGLFRHVDRFPWVGRISALDLDEQSYLARAWARDERPIATPADGHPGYPTYGVAAYSKPASMLHTLRGMVGDSLFTEFLHLYYRRNLLRHPRPPDVIRAADDATGQDLAPFFRSWVETIDRPSFALGAIRRERAGADYRTSVVVVRKEAMVLPVTVEATFADGTRQERRILARDRRTPAVFESRSPLRSARLDPRHEIIEMDRLDNGSGTLPPMRFHFLTGFPSAEAIGVSYGPTIWHGEEEGLRLGGWMDGRYLPSGDFPCGIYGFDGGLSYGARDGSVAYRAGLWGRAGVLGARSRLRTLIARDEGLFRAGLHAENTAMAPARRHPYRSWKLSAEYRDRSELRAVDPQYWSRGKTWNGGLALGLETIGPRHSESVQIEYRRGISVGGDQHHPLPTWNYNWLRLTANQNLSPLPGGLKASWRIAAGTAFNQVPSELQFDVAEESRLDALDRFYANDRGPLRESDHFFVPGGGGARGYSGRAILGKRLLAATLEIEHAGYPVYLFSDAGRVEASGLGEDAVPSLRPLVGRTLADAGVGVRYGPIDVAFPVWVGSPASEESPWHVRWRFSIGTVHLPTP